MPLYVGLSRSDYKTLDLAIILLGRNLRNILSALERIKEREGYGSVTSNMMDTSFRSKIDQDVTEEPKFKNKILLFLYRIAEFQVY